MLIRIALRSVFPLSALLASACSASPSGSVADGAVAADVAPADAGGVYSAPPPDLGGVDSLFADAGGSDLPTADVARDAPTPSQDCAQTVGGRGGGEVVLRFESEQPPVRVHLLRRFVSVGAGESSIFALRGLWIEQGAAAARSCIAIVEPASLEYVN